MHPSAYYIAFGVAFLYFVIRCLFRSNSEDEDRPLKPIAIDSAIVLGCASAVMYIISLSPSDYLPTHIVEAAETLGLVRVTDRSVPVFVTDKVPF